MEVLSMRYLKFLVYIYSFKYIITLEFYVKTILEVLQCQPIKADMNIVLS